VKRKNGVFLRFVVFLWLIVFADVGWAYPLEDTYGDDLVFANNIVNYQSVDDSNVNDDTFAGGSQQLSEAEVNQRISNSPDYFDNGGTTVSLGAGGAIIVEFGESDILGGGDSGYDLFIYEVEDQESLQVSLISNQGRQFEFTNSAVISVQGSDAATGQTRSTNIFQFDIDSLLGNLAAGEFFQHVKIMDGNSGSGTDGADIDAIGMIAGVATTIGAANHISEPTTTMLLVFGFLGLMVTRSRHSVQAKLSNGPFNHLRAA